MHGLRGHPRHTWEATRAANGEGTQTAAPKKRRPITSFFHSKPPTSSTIKPNEELSDKLFWPDEYLTRDIPDARVWTYGYNADAISGFFQANNKNGVSQHSRDLEVQIERDIDNGVTRPVPWSGIAG